MATLDTYKARAAARGWVTRTSIRLEELCSKDDVDLVELRDVIDEFDSRMSKLDCIQSEHEINLDEKDLDEDIDRAATFREKSRRPRITAAKLLSSKDDASGSVNNHTSTSSHGVVQAKLPKLELPHFDGDPLKWTAFWEQYEVVVHNSDMPEVTKFSYLLSLLHKEAKATVQGLSLTSANYGVAIELLNKRFGRPERIVFSHIQELLNINLPKHAKVPVLWAMYNELQTHVRSLETLGVSGKQYGVVLTPMILSRLPADMRLEWAREGEEHETDLKWLLDFLQREIERRERSQAFTHDASSVEVVKQVTQHVPTAAALISNLPDAVTPPHRETCPICGRAGHPVQRCYSLTKVDVGQRREVLRHASVCFRCLSGKKGHKFRGCEAKCSKCKGNHHAILCDKVAAPVSDSDRNVASDSVTASVSHIGVSCGSAASGSESSGFSVSKSRSTVLLQTLRVKIHGARGVTDAVVLFDTGSDKTYISQRLVNKVNPEWVTSESVAYAAFGSSSATSAELRNVYNVNLQGKTGKTESVLATEIPVICSPLHCPSIPQDVLSSFGDLDVVDVCAGQEVVIDLLIGLDFYWKLMTPEMVSLAQGLVGQRTVFGWVVSGSMPDMRSVHNTTVSHQLFCLTDFSESDVRSFWDLESIGVGGCEAPVADRVLEEFQEKVTFSDNRYEVALPWKSSPLRPSLLNNEKLALSRLERLTHKLAKDPDLEVQYHTALAGYLTEGFIQEVPINEIQESEPIYYMPHRPVVKASSLTTKVRPVFDASAKGFNGVSLNDCLHTGPSLIPNLPGILMRFRRWEVALSADVTKAFLQIQVQPADRDVHRFLWDDQGTVRVMRFVRLPFGNKSSPFLLNATVKYHLAKFSPSRVVEELSENMYVDDLLTGCDDDSESCDLLREANKVMSQASMTLAKWSSNSEQVGEVLSREFCDRSSGEKSLKVLGLRWLASEDCFSFDGISVAGDLCITKRVVLSFTARLFDPLGFLTPFTIIAKCMFQELWQLGLGWDELVPDETRKRFLCWIEGLEVLRKWKIPRNYTGGRWRDVVVFQLHAFGDASQMAYGACVYLRVQLQNGSWKSSLVFSKNKVAPLKRVTLPRLELLAALLCARLLVYVREALKLPVDVAYNCWTDSTVALAWIQSDPGKWKPFVGNRVAEIQSLSTPSQWRHCPGDQNPADLVTRGIPAEELIKSDLWLCGPDFLSEGAGSVVEPARLVPGDPCVDNVPITDEDPENCEARSGATMLVVDKDPVTLLECERWSSFSKAIRVMGWILRFAYNVRQPKDSHRTGDLTLQEMCLAKTTLFRTVQNQEYSEECRGLAAGQQVSRKSPIFKLSPFLDEEGLMRVQGRLHFSELSYESKHPVILPKCHLSLLLIRHFHGIMKHAGVSAMLVRLRDEYWIVGARRICKRVKHECLSCQRQDAVAGDQTMAPLPKLRVTQAPAFSVTGLDHGGPLYCCDSGNKKFYVLLFTCAVVRAVHLELVDSLSAETTMYALRRMVSRRGMPSIIMSDNARGFVAAKDLVLKFYGPDGPEWRFIVPRAPWWGGWWERLIKTVKSSLKRAVGKKSLTRVELETSLHEIEACVNSRPLTFVGDEIENGAPLTPSHFLVGRPLTCGPVRINAENTLVSAQDLVVRQESQKQLLDQFWSSWSSEYIRNLPACKGSEVSKGGLQVGSMVLVRDENYPRLQWPLGIVERVFPGRDGLIRSAEIRTSKSVLTRPIQHIHDLEINDRIHDLPRVPCVNETPISGDPYKRDTPTKESVIEKGTPVNTGVLDSASDNEPDTVQQSRCGRQIKAPKRLDL